MCYQVSSLSGWFSDCFPPIHLPYLDLQEARKLLGLMMSLAASCIGDKDNREEEVVVLVQKLLKCSSSCWNHRAATKQDAIHIKENARLVGKQVGQAHIETDYYLKHRLLLQPVNSLLILLNIKYHSV